MMKCVQLSWLEGLTAFSVFRRVFSICALLLHSILSLLHLGTTLRARNILPITQVQTGSEWQSVHMSLNTHSKSKFKNVQTEFILVIQIDVIPSNNSMLSLPHKRFCEGVGGGASSMYHMSVCMQRGLEVLVHDLLNNMFVLAAATAREWALTSTNPEAWPSTNKPILIGTHHVTCAHDNKSIA
jgi:hypothetical protein